MVGALTLPPLHFVNLMRVTPSSPSASVSSPSLPPQYSLMLQKDPATGVFTAKAHLPVRGRLGGWAGEVL